MPHPPSAARSGDLPATRGGGSASELPFSRQAVAKHLAVLERAGLVEGRRQGREVRYAVDSERLAVAAEAMTRVATQWDQRLAAIKRIAEAVHREGSATDE